MNCINQTTTGEKELVISFCDLTRFAKWCHKREDQEIVDLLKSYYQLTSEIVEKSGGTIIKFIGDASLIIYPIENADAGVTALLELKKEVDKWTATYNFTGELIIKAHAGTAVLTQTAPDSRLDVFGKSVNTTAMMTSHGLAISPQLFRKLSIENRTLFKKHTPVIRYIACDEKHVD